MIRQSIFEQKEEGKGPSAARAKEAGCIVIWFNQKQSKMIAFF